MIQPLHMLARVSNHHYHPGMLITSLLLTLLLPQQDRFLSEFGESYDLDGAHPFPNPEVGVVICRFNFQSTIQDATTGLYIVPDFSFAYSIEEDGVNPATYTAAGNTWVFGGPYLAPPEQIISFSTATGAGEAKAFLPLNYVSPEHIWGQPPFNRSWMTVYWGVGQEVDHDGLNPPTLAQGSKVVQLDTFFPTVSILIYENHALVLDQESSLGIVASTIETFDRVFTLSAADPGYLDLQESVVLPAGAQSVIAGIVPRQVGLTRVLATSPSYSGQVFRSQKAEIRPPVVVTAPGSTPEEPGVPGVGMPNRYCVHTKPSTPNGGPDSAEGSHNIWCSYCDSTPQDPCEYNIGQTVIAWEDYRCPMTLMDACFQKNGYTQFMLSNWMLVDKWTEKCNPSGWDRVAQLVWDVDEWRVCCKYERIEGETQKSLRDCF